MGKPFARFAYRAVVAALVPVLVLAATVTPASALSAKSAVRFTSATFSTSEAASAVSISLMRSGNLSHRTTVFYQSSQGSATPGADYHDVMSSVTFGLNQQVATFFVPILNDAVAEPSETVNLSFSVGSNSTIGSPATAVLTILDDDTAPPPPAVTAAIGNVSATEGNAGSAPATFTVTLSGPAASPTTITFATADGTATAGADYTAASGSITIPTGGTSAPLAVQVLGDTLDEPNETFTVGVTLDGTTVTGTGTILDDDEPAGLPALSVGDRSVTEGNAGSTPAGFTVTLSAAAAAPVTVEFSTTDGTATAGADYTAGTGTLTFSPGVTTQTITVSVLGDVLDEADETFTVNLSGATNASIADAAATGTIVDDDALPDLSVAGLARSEGNTGTTPFPFSVTLSAASGRPVSVDAATSDGTATTAGGDYTAISQTLTFAPGETTKIFTVQVNGDTANEATETFNVALSGALNASIVGGPGVGSIVNDDASLPALTVANAALGESVGLANVQVALTSPSDGTVSVQYTTSNGTATAGADYTAVSGTLTFPVGATTQMIQVPITNDSLDEVDETLFVDLSAPVGAMIADGQGVVTILDEDPVPTLVISDRTVTEGNTGVTGLSLSVTLSTASGRTVTVNYATADGTARSGPGVGGNDYSMISGTLVFPPGTTTVPLNIGVNGDLTDEPNETFNVNLLSPVNAAISKPQGVVTILDDDAPPTITISDVTLTEGNSGPKAFTFTVSLSVVSAQLVTVNAATANGSAIAGSDYVAASGLLSFPPGQATQTFTVQVVGDTMIEAEETFFLNLFSAANAAIGDGQGIGRIVNDDSIF